MSELTTAEKLREAAMADVVEAARGWAVDDDDDCECSLCLSIGRLDALASPVLPAEGDS